MTDGTREKQRALERAIRALAARAHSEHEIVEKLTRAGYDERIIAETMHTLSKHELVNDASFARQWAGARARRGMGPFRIAQELRHKGISREDADNALAQLDEDIALEQATALALKHLQKGDDRAKRRAYEALIRRGHSYDTARAALAEAERQLEEED